MDAGLLSVLSQIIGFLIALTVHEFAHAWMANRLGDSTAKYEGRMSLNPLRHIDFLGTVLLPATLLLMRAPFVFGWAKPVPVNPYNLKGKYGEAWVSLAGPGINFLVALLFALIFRFVPDMLFTSWSASFRELMAIIIGTNIILGVFNLLPFAPLDGSGALHSFLPDKLQNVKEFLEKYGIYLLIAFILFGGSLITGVSMLLLAIFLGPRGGMFLY